MLRAGAVAQDPTFLRGDANDDGAFNIADPIRTLNILFPGDLGSSAPQCWSALDGNDDGDVDVADPVFLLLSLFQSGFSDSPPPFTNCGTDPTPDTLQCVTHTGVR